MRPPGSCAHGHLGRRRALRVLVVARAAEGGTGTEQNSQGKVVVLFVIFRLRVSEPGKPRASTKSPPTASGQAVQLKISVAGIPSTSIFLKSRNSRAQGTDKRRLLGGRVHLARLLYIASSCHLGVAHKRDQLNEHQRGWKCTPRVYALSSCDTSRANAKLIYSRFNNRTGNK